MRIKYFLILLLISLMSSTAVHAETYKLFIEGADTSFAPIDSASNLVTGAEKLVAQGIYNNGIAGSVSNTSVISLALFGKSEDFEVENVIRKSKGRVSYVASSSAQNTISVAENNGSVVGSLWQDGTLYKLRPAADGSTILIEVPSKALVDHDENYQENTDFVDVSPALDNESDSAAEYTVLVTYTSRFASAAGNVSAFMDLLELETNTAYTNSGVTTSVNIVHSYQTAYDEGVNGNFSVDRTYFRNAANAEVIELRALREQHSADIMIILTGNVYSSCGVAQGIGVTAEDAFGFASETCAAGYYSFGHEVGHLFGARHIITQDPTSTPYAYGHGYCNVTSGTWRTVMSYNCPSNTGGPRIQQWSNPEVSLSGQPTGSVLLEHNARVLNVRALTVANFRSSQPVVSSPYPVDGTTVTEGASGQLLRIAAAGATSGVIFYDDDDSFIDFAITATVNGDFLEATIPYVSGRMNNDGTNYWYVEAANAAGTTRYPNSGNLSFTVTLAPVPPVVSSPNPVDGATVTEGASGQLLRVTAAGATSGVISFDDDSDISFSTIATVNGDFLEATIPYVSGSMNNDGINYWHVEATNAAGTTRYPNSGNLSFTVTLAPTAPVVLSPNPFDGATVTEGAFGQLLRVTAAGATSGVISFDDDSDISFSTIATVNGDFLEATIPYVSGSMNNDGINYWHVEATNAAGTTRYPNSGNLSFTVTLAPLPLVPDLYEPDNNSGQASAIQSGVLQNHNITPADDEDWVTFTLAEVSDITVETAGGSGDTRMWLYDGSLGEIAFDDNGGNALFSKITMTNLPAGTYFVAVDENGNNSEIPSYTISASYLAEPDDDFLLMLIPTVMSAVKQKQLKLGKQK